MSSKILIVEDKQLLAMDMEDRVVSMGLGTVIGTFASAEDAMDFSFDNPPDIALLDINLKGEMDGIELAEALNEEQYTPVIYLTHLEDEATFDRTSATYPIAYLNKPFTNNELKTAISNAKRALELRPEGTTGEQNIQRDSDEIKILNDRIFVRNGRGKFKIPIKDIVYIQSGGGEKSTIMTVEYLEKERKVPPTVGYSLSKLEPRVAFYPYLVRCSRFHMVNLQYVDRILDTDRDHEHKGKKSLIVRGEEIKVGEKYRKEVLGRLRIL